MPISKIPKDQLDAPKVRYKLLNGNEYLITSDIRRETFVLWKVIKGDKETYEKIDTGKSPKELYPRCK